MRPGLADMSRRFFRASVRGVTLMALLASCAGSSPHAPAARSRAEAGPQVRLVLLIAVDQFRPDYLTRFGPLPAGFRTLMSRGAVFTDAHLEHGVTVTAVGHATMLTGATPSVSGIIDNIWYERASKSTVESITDQDVQIVGGDDAAGIGASPRRLLVTTLGDQIKLASGAAPGTPDAPKVIGIALKDRGAILPVGHAADGAYFLRGGRIVTSTYYRPDLPAWVAEVNARQLPESYAGKRWDLLLPAAEYPEADSVAAALPRSASSQTSQPSTSTGSSAKASRTIAWVSGRCSPISGSRCRARRRSIVRSASL